MGAPSNALRALESVLGRYPEDTPLTVKGLHEIVGEAAKDAEQREWEDYMGDDL